MSRKIKLILFVILVIALAGVGFFVYNFLISKKAKPTVEDVALTQEERKQLTLTEEEKKEGVTLEEKEKEIAESKKSDVLRRLLGEEEKEPALKVVAINKIIDKKVKFSVLSADQKKIFYFDSEAHEFYQAELDGTNLVAVTRGNFVNLQDVSWSADRSKAILSVFGQDGKTLEYFYFDFTTQESKKIDPRFQNVAVDPTGTKIAYIYSEPDKNIFNFSVADPDGKNWRKIAFLDKEEGKFAWLGADKTVFYHLPSSGEQGSLFVYDVAEGKDSFIFLSGKYGFAAKFSQDGKRILWQEGSKGESRPALYTSELGRGKSSIKIPLNGLAEKCAWYYDNVTVLCAIPENFSNYYRQPESWLNNEFVSRDSFYKINTKSNEVTTVADASQFDKDYDVSDSFMMPDGKTMYFVRKHDDKLYQLAMP